MFFSLLTLFILIDNDFLNNRFFYKFSKSFKECLYFLTGDFYYFLLFIIILIQLIVFSPFKKTKKIYSIFILSLMSLFLPFFIHVYKIVPLEVGAYGQFLYLWLKFPLIIHLVFFIWIFSLFFISFFPFKDKIASFLVKL